MRYLIILVLVFAACTQQENKLEEKEQTLELIYVTWDSGQANWITAEDFEKYIDQHADTLASHCIYLEPADTSLRFPDSLGKVITGLSVTGHFYNEKGVPPEFAIKKKFPVEARIFSFTSLKVTRRDSSMYYPNTDSLYYRIKDTLVVKGRAAVFYVPDDKTMTKKMSDEKFRIWFDDVAGTAQEVYKYCDSVKLRVLDNENKHYLKFITNSGKSFLFKTTKLPDLIGMYLFDPAKQPKMIDMFDFEKEYANYYKQ